MAVLIVIVTIGLVGGYVWKAHSRPQESGLPAFRPGAISVGFKDGVTSDQAIKLIKSYSLTTNLSEHSLRGYFIPTVGIEVRPVPDTNLIESLKQNPDVIEVDAGTPDYVSSGQYLTIHFKEGTREDKINQLLTSINPSANQPYTDQQALKFVLIDVPVGKENSYISKFRQSPIVAQADVIQDLLL